MHQDAPPRLQPRIRLLLLLQACTPSKTSEVRDTPFEHFKPPRVKHYTRAETLYRDGIRRFGRATPFVTWSHSFCYSFVRVHVQTSARVFKLLDHAAC